MFREQEKRLDYLVQALCEDSDNYKDLEVAPSERRRVMRSLMNIRPPKPISARFLEVQDAYLQAEAQQKGVVTLGDIPTLKEAYGSSRPFADKLAIWQGDITRLQVGAIVNAANNQMLGCFVPCHGCIDNAIHSAAGVQLREACHAYMSQKRQGVKDYVEPTGEALVTPAYNLPCDYVVHTVGPIVYGALTDALREDLRQCYRTCLEKMVEKGIKSIAFCCISTGEFHFPNEEAAHIAVEEVDAFLQDHARDIECIILNVFKDIDLHYYETLLR